MVSLFYLLWRATMSDIKNSYKDNEDGSMLITREQDTTVMEALNEDLRSINKGKSHEELTKDGTGYQSANVPMILVEAWLSDNNYAINDFMLGTLDEAFYAWLNSEQMKPWMTTDNPLKVLER